MRSIWRRPLDELLAGRCDLKARSGRSAPSTDRSRPSARASPGHRMKSIKFEANLPKSRAAAFRDREVCALGLMALADRTGVRGTKQGIEPCSSSELAFWLGVVVLLMPDRRAPAGSPLRHRHGGGGAGDHVLRPQRHNLRQGGGDLGRLPRRRPSSARALAVDLVSSSGRQSPDAAQPPRHDTSAERRRTARHAVRRGHAAGLARSVDAAARAPERPPCLTALDALRGQGLRPYA